MIYISYAYIREKGDLSHLKYSFVDIFAPNPSRVKFVRCISLLFYYSNNIKVLFILYLETEYLTGPRATLPSLVSLELLASSGLCHQHCSYRCIPLRLADPSLKLLNTFHFYLTVKPQKSSGNNQIRQMSNIK